MQLLDGAYSIQGVKLLDVCAEVGTPLYVYDIRRIESRVRTFHDAFAEVDHLLAYSVKANGNLTILRRLRELGTVGGAFETRLVHDLADEVRAEPTGPDDFERPGRDRFRRHGPAEIPQPQADAAAQPVDFENDVGVAAAAVGVHDDVGARLVDGERDVGGVIVVEAAGARRRHDAGAHHLQPVGRRAERELQ